MYLDSMRKHLDNWVWFDDGWLPERAVRYDAAGGGHPLQSLVDEPPKPASPQLPAPQRGPYRTNAKS